MDILVCRLRYPNDPTGNVRPHQHYVGYAGDDGITLYSISSILGKEKRVYSAGGNAHPHYYLLKGQQMTDCCLKVPSFIDCTKAYRLELTKAIKITNLSHRTIPQHIKNGIDAKITELKSLGRHTEYSIRMNEFVADNPKCR
jgi:hypothetical protein